MTASESKVGSESAPKSQFISCGCGGSKLKREIRRAMDVGIKMEPWRFLYQWRQMCITLIRSRMGRIKGKSRISKWKEGSWFGSASQCFRFATLPAILVHLAEGKEGLISYPSTFIHCILMQEIASQDQCFLIIVNYTSFFCISEDGGFYSLQTQSNTYKVFSDYDKIRLAYSQNKHKEWRMRWDFFALSI